MGKHIRQSRHICYVCQDLCAFSSEEITRDSLHLLNRTMLKELDIKTMGNVLTMLKLTKEPLVSPASHMKPPTAKLPQVSPEMTTQFRAFLQTWCVRHRLSTIAYPQSNGWAELTVKTTKRMVNRNTCLQGSLDNVARAILQYRNTPIEGIGLSLVRLLLHHQLCNSIPSQPTLYKPHPELVTAAQCRDELLHHQNSRKVQ